LCESLFGGWDDALLFRKLATLRLPVFDYIDDYIDALRWKGPRSNFE